MQKKENTTEHLTKVVKKDQVVPEDIFFEIVPRKKTRIAVFYWSDFEQIKHFAQNISQSSPINFENTTFALGSMTLSTLLFCLSIAFIEYPTSVKILGVLLTVIFSISTLLFGMLARKEKREEKYSVQQLNSFLGRLEAEFENNQESLVENNFDEN